MIKKITITAALALCAGCSNNDSKLEALSLKLDQIIQTQAVLNAKLDALPSTKQLDGMAFYYHTNTLNALFSESDKILKQNALASSLASQYADLLYTNLARLEAGQNELQQSVWDGNNSSSTAVFILTNGLMPDVFYTREASHEFIHDFESIKTRLGISE
jgi:hypothetical protein